MQEKSPGATAPTIFNFSPSFSVRIVTRDGEPWFVAKDIAEALDYVWGANKTIGHVPEEWKGVESVPTPSGEQDMLILAEQGVYFFLGRSDKPKALPFQKWLAGEVLPEIRKTGRYVAPDALPVEVAVETINPAQYQALARKVWLIGNAFHMADSAQWWAWKSIRALSGVGAKELPARLFPDAIQILDYQEKSSMAFKSRVVEAEELFMRGRLKALSEDFSHILAEERQKVLMSITA
jgi:prophage antirepressor-like protein